MLEIRPTCEHCNKLLPYNSTEAMICGFECTYCKDCATTILKNVCPNCGGGFTPRPIRPKKYLEKFPPKAEPVYNPTNMEKHAYLLHKFKDVNPEDR